MVEIIAQFLSLNSGFTSQYEGENRNIFASLIYTMAIMLFISII
jgi:hypothetical protein